MNKVLMTILTAIFIVGALQTASAQQRVALYRYVSPVSMNDAYAAAPADREKYKKAKYEEIGIVGYVYLDKQPGTIKLLSLVKKNADGTGEHFYSADFNQILAKQESEGLGKWVINPVNKGVAGYVPASGGAGAKAVTRFLQKDGKTGIYAFSKAETSGLTAKGLSSQGTAFYIYESAATEASGTNSGDGKKIDLQIGEIVKVNDNSVTFRARSIGGDAEKQTVRIKITAYNPNGSIMWGQTHLISESFPRGVATVATVNLTGGKTFSGTKFKLKIDGDDQFAETNETNNESKLTAGPSAGAPPDQKLEKIPGAPAADIDLSVRKALYFNEVDSAKLSTTSRYTAPGKSPLLLKRSQALACSSDACEYYLGFFAMRGAATEPLSTYATLSGVSFGVVGNTIAFASGERSKGVVYKIKLKTGVNTVEVTIDPASKIAETDENNNSFEVTVMVEP